MLIHRSLCACVALGVSLAASSAHAGPQAPQEKFGKKAKGWGLGVSLGDVTGASIKKFLHPQHALQFHLGWAPLHNGDGIFSFEYLWHSKPQGESPIVDVMLAAGLGVGVGFWARETAALQLYGREATAGVGMLVRAPVLGLVFHWLEYPIDTALELAWSPYVLAVGGSELRHGDASIKVRYFF